MSLNKIYRVFDTKRYSDESKKSENEYAGENRLRKNDSRRICRYESKVRRTSNLQNRDAADFVRRTIEKNLQEIRVEGLKSSTESNLPSNFVSFSQKDNLKDAQVTFK